MTCGSNTSHCAPDFLIFFRDLASSKALTVVSLVGFGIDPFRRRSQ